MSGKHRHVGIWGAPMAAPSRHLTLSSGVGLVVTNTIGAGIFLGAGFMVQEMDPLAILLAWVFGALLAGCGAVAYGAIAKAIGRSGGEYRYLSDLVHPAVGYIAGWASLFMGFAAPVAIDARAAGEYVHVFAPSLDPRVFASGLIVALTALHAANLAWSRRTQNAFAFLKLGVVLGFVALGLSVGNVDWPEWSPPKASTGFPWVAFLENQLWIAFAFSGWNAAIYAASEFRRPERDVPRATLLGWALVSALYLVVNWVFVSNLTPDRAAAVFNHETTRITLGHLIAQDLLGPLGGAITSGALVMVFVGAGSAMMFVGPRVVAAMAEDGWLPSVFAPREGRPPVAAVVVQGAIALLFLHTHTLREAVQGVASVLLGLAALSAGSVFRISRLGLPTPSRFVRAAAATYAIGASGILVLACTQLPHLLTSLVGFGAIGAVAWVAHSRGGGMARGSAPTALNHSAGPTE